MPPANILFLSHYFPPEGNAPATRVFELCRRWAKAGHCVTVITGVPNVPDGKVYDGYRNRLWQREEMDGIRVIRVWTYLAPNKGTARRIANYVSFMVAAAIAGCFTRRPEIIIATSPQFFCGWAGAILSKLRRRPFILEIRDIWPESIRVVGAMRSRGLLSLLEWLEKRLYAASDHIVTVGEGYRKQLCERGVPALNISVVMNGVDRESYATPPEGAKVRQKFGLDSKFVCSYIGTVGMACGLQVVLRAAAKLKDRESDQIRFLIVGDGALLQMLREEAQRAGLSNVIFTGRQAKESMPEFLAASDSCLVHLKKQALFASVMPSKIFEALAMRRPVILGVEGFAADFIRKSGGGLCIEPENEDQLLLAAERLQTDPALAQSLGRAGCDFVLKHFDRDVLAKDYLKVIEQVIATGSGVLRHGKAPQGVANP
jgi:glycosyltransferase involved in cell wall biosynthesis